MRSSSEYSIALGGTASSGGSQQLWTLGEAFFARHEGLVHGGHGRAQAEWRSTGSGRWQLKLSVEASVTVSCDRCLADMQVAVAGEDTMPVCAGEAFGDDGETLVVDRRTLQLPVEHLLHELVELSLPYRLCHEEGQCDASVWRSDMADGGDAPPASPERPRE